MPSTKRKMRMQWIGDAATFVVFVIVFFPFIIMGGFAWLAFDLPERLGLWRVE
ncbi:MAG: hypothetical protein O7G84_01090 [Gammaproteobacteria bacterium]|nr:hypothetical protein [Gammaproteobacteria bacterium]